MNMETDATIGLLFMAYGSPESLDQVEDYLLDVREGRPASPELIAEIRRRYASIGGRSPLLKWSKAQAEAVAAELNRRHASDGLHFRAYIGMRHWQPRIRNAVEEMIRDDIRQAVALVLAPHSSRLSVGKYYQHLDESLGALNTQIELVCIQNWHTHPGFIAALKERFLEARHHFAEGDEPFVLFTAHSLPTRLLEMGDTYETQLQETAHLLAESLDLKDGRWQFCYQSAGAGGGTWLGPQIEEVIPALAKNGERNVLVAPIGFVCDHIEVLYDIDIGCQQIARQHGIRLERSPSLNTHPLFIQALADVITEALAGLTTSRSNKESLSHH